MIFEEKFFPIETFNIGIDSQYRDLEKYASPSQYTISFESIFKNVVSFQLVFAVYEKNGVEPYVNLVIEEMSPNLISNSNPISGSFCQLPLISPLNTYNTSLYKCVKTFEKPLAKLSKLSIKFVKSDGTLYPMREHFLKFEISCLKFSGGKTKEWSNNEMFTQSISVYEPTTKHLNVPPKYDMAILKTAFKSACDMLRSQGLPQQVFKAKYNEIKAEFRTLAQDIA